jgi:hypothetical protein
MKIIFFLNLLFVFICGFKSKAANLINFNGTYHNAGKTSVVNPSKPAPLRSQFFTSVEKIDDNSSKLTVTVWNGFKKGPNSHVSLGIRVAVNDGKDRLLLVPIKILETDAHENNGTYAFERTYILDYAELNKSLRKLLPNNNSNLKIGPGTPIFIHGYWKSMGHYWGLIDRGGVVYLPSNDSSSGQAASTRRSEDLDLAYPITKQLAQKYNTVKPNGDVVGLKEGGQIKSRIEMEGKYQVAEDQIEDILKDLFDLSKNQSAAEKILGKGWELKLEDRYLKKDSSGKLALDKNGFPIPDPMDDIYHDSKAAVAAQSDMAFRYRYTQGNGYGSWNYKPSMGIVDNDGIVLRVEDAIDTTDNNPASLKKFAESSDPLNMFFYSLRNIFSTLSPSVQLIDTRYKFKAKNKQGMVVEVSLDLVKVKSKRSSKTAEFYQLEMDVDHPSTSTANIASVARGVYNSSGSQEPSMVINEKPKTIDLFRSSSSFLDGRPVLHTEADLDPKSPVNVKHAKDFSDAKKMIVNLRDHLLGRDWVAAPQKAALASYLVGLVNERNASPSVKRLFRSLSEKRLDSSRFFTKKIKVLTCSNLF